MRVFGYRVGCCHEDDFRRLEVRLDIIIEILTSGDSALAEKLRKDLVDLRGAEKAAQTALNKAPKRKDEPR